LSWYSSWDPADRQEGPTVRVWDAATGKRLRELSWDLSKGPWAGLSADAGVQAQAGKQGEVVLRDLATGKDLRRLTHEGREVTALGLSPDGALLAVETREDPEPPGRTYSPWSRAIHLWDVRQGNKLWRDGPRASRVWAFDFSPDGSALAMVSESGESKGLLTL